MIIINLQHLERAIREVVIITVGLNTFGGHIVERKIQRILKNSANMKTLLSCSKLLLIILFLL